MSSLITDMQLRDVVLLSSRFDVSETSPSKNAQMSLTVDTSDTDYSVKDGLEIATTQMTVSSSLVSDDQDDPNMQLKVTVAVVASCSAGNDDDVTHREQLRRQTIISGYEFIRNHTMRLANASPMMRFILPSIDEKLLMD